MNEEAHRKEYRIDRIARSLQAKDCEGSKAQRPIALRADHPDNSASVTIVALGYRGPCTKPGCRNLGRLILRSAGAGGRGA
jgi:hypothetical protein